MYRPKEVAEQFGVTPATLRLWSTHFEDHLSPAAQRAMTENGGAAQRRYTDDDLRVLSRAKTLLATGFTYEEVKLRLGGIANEGVPGDTGGAADAPLAPAVARDEPTSAIDTTFPEPARLVIAALQESLQAKEETLGSKQETIAALTTTVAVLQEQLAGLKDEMAERRAMAAAPPPVSWWRRLFGWAHPQMDPIRSANLRLQAPPLGGLTGERGDLS
jgi:DNA-binding transcriptional MerR regulator